jgi:hypothetical protein
MAKKVARSFQVSSSNNFPGHYVKDIAKINKSMDKQMKSQTFLSQKTHLVNRCTSSPPLRPTMAGPDSVCESVGNSSSTEDRSSTVNEIGTANNEVHKLKLAENEHRAVVRSKVVVILTLLGAATVLGLVTHSMISREETADFKSQVSITFTRSILICFLVYFSNLLTNEFFSPSLVQRLRDRTY